MLWLLVCDRVEKLMLLERCMEPIRIMLPFRLPMSFLALRLASRVGLIFYSDFSSLLIWLITILGRANALMRAIDELLLALTPLEPSLPSLDLSAAAGTLRFKGLNAIGVAACFLSSMPLFYPSSIDVKSSRTFVSTIFLASRPSPPIPLDALPLRSEPGTYLDGVEGLPSPCIMLDGARSRV